MVKYMYDVPPKTTGNFTRALHTKDNFLKKRHQNCINISTWIVSICQWIHQMNCHNESNYIAYDPIKFMTHKICKLPTLSEL